MKILERIEKENKKSVYERYARCVPEMDEYDHINNKDMVRDVYKSYDGYKGIIDITTYEELKLLKKILANNNEIVFNKDDFYLIKNLKDKFLLITTDKEHIYSIPDEIITSIKEAIENVDWAKKEKHSHTIKCAVGLLRIMGLMQYEAFESICKSFTDSDDIRNTIWEDKLFNFYIITDNDTCYYIDYIDLLHEFTSALKKYARNTTLLMNEDILLAVFETGFDTTNEVVNKFFKKFKNIPNYYIVGLEIERTVLLNADRTKVKKLLRKLCPGHDDLLSDLDDVMDNMPSGVLLGKTALQYKEIIAREEMKKFNDEMYANNQVNACLDEKDRNLFYKLYFHLLEYTNTLYKVDPRIEVLKLKPIRGNDIHKILNKFGDKKDIIVNKFISVNPYNFSEDELNLVSSFKNSIRDYFTIIKYDHDYTEMLSAENKIYMVKGVATNIDKIFPSKNIPVLVETTLVQFKGNIVCDCFLNKSPLPMGSFLDEITQKAKESTDKFYKL